MSTFADGLTRNTSASGDPLDYLGEGDFQKVMDLVNPTTILTDVSMNPGVPISKRAAWLSKMAATPQSQPVSLKQGGPNREGFIVADPVVLNSINSQEAWIARRSKYGFRFLYNPTTFVESYTRPMDVNYVAYLQGLSELTNMPAMVNTGSTLNFTLFLSRSEDMRVLRQPGWEAAYSTGITPQQRDDILRKGTMADIEYLFRITNGEPFDTWHGTTSNWGMLIPMAVNVFMGDSAGARKIRGVIQNISWVHQQFAPGMIPVYTELAVTITRIPDNYFTEVPDASGAVGGTSGTGTSVDGGSVDLPSVGGWTVPTRYNQISSPWGWRTINGVSDFHYGIDLDPGPNQHPPITTIRDGVVVDKGYDSGRGNYVNIQHVVPPLAGMYLSEYMHMNEPARVKVGDRVQPGTIIGYVGTTGQSTGTHLHLGIRYDNERVDPQKVMTFPESAQ